MRREWARRHPRSVAYDHGAHVTGPFYHGRETALAVGDGLVPGHGSNFGHDPNVLNAMLKSTSRSCENGLDVIDD